MSKSKPTLTDKLASALLTMMRENGNGELERIIPHEHAKLMTPDQIISLFHFDHYPIREADGGPCEPWNLEPRPILEHRRKTAEIDNPQLAKQRRIRGELKPKPKRKWASQKLQGRPFDRGRKRSFGR